MNKKELKIEKITATNKKEYEEQLANIIDKDFDILLFSYLSYLPINHYKKYKPLRESSNEDFRVDLFLVNDDPKYDVQKQVDILKEELLDLSKKVSKPVIIMNEESFVGAIFVSYANYFAKDSEKDFMLTTGQTLSLGSNVERGVFSKSDIEEFKAINYKGLKIGLDGGLGGYDEEKYMAFYKINKGIDYIIECVTAKVWRY